LAEEARHRGELDDVTRTLAVIEEARQSDVLKAYQSRTRQNSSIATWEEGWSGTGAALRETAREIVPDELDYSAFDEGASADEQIREYTAEVKQKFEDIHKSLNELAAHADTIRDEWQNHKNSSRWKTTVDAANSDYQELKSKLAEQEANDPNIYDQLVNQRQGIEKRLKEFEERKKQAVDRAPPASARDT
jgi:DNA repair exonuclease SbcCD ATPase subunit